MISAELIYGTGWGKFKWKEKGKSPMVLVLGPGIPIGGGGTGPLLEDPDVLLISLFSPTRP